MASGGGTPVTRVATGPVHEGKTTWAVMGVHVLEQTLACAGGSACALPCGFAQVAGGMCGEGRQVGHHQQVGQAPAFMSEIVPVGLGHVEGLVLDPPPGASAGGDCGDIILRDVEVGGEAVAAGHLAAGPGGLDLKPGDAGRIGAVAQGRAGHPSVSVEAFARTRPAVRWISCGPVPRRYSPNVLWLDGLHTKMKLPPAAWTASQSGWRVWRSSPKWTGRSPTTEGPTRAGQRRAARLPQSCLSVPSLGRTNSGADGGARPWPGATIDAQTKPGKYTTLPPARRVGHCLQCGLRDRKRPEPSDAADTRPSRHRMSDSAPTPSRSAMIAENTLSKYSGGMPSSIWRVWLSHGMRSMPNGSRAFEMPRPSERRRRCDKKDGLRMGNTENAARPISRIAYRALRPDRPSGSDTHRSPTSPTQRSRFPIPRLESHIQAHENPIKNHNENC